MTLLRKLLASKANSAPAPEARGERAAGGWDPEFHHSMVHETRPYVIAMREVAADAFRSF